MYVFYILFYFKVCYYFICKEVFSLKIIKYQKIKKNIYLVNIDQEQYSLYDDVIVKYNLLLKKEITKKELDEIIKYNKELECYYDALKYLNYKMRTKNEVIKYLSKNFSNEEIKQTIKKLIKENYLNDELYINSYLNDSLKFSSFGKLKIKQKLLNLGLDENLVLNHLNEVDDKIWQEKCDKLALKKVKSYKDSSQLVKKKVKNYLLNNGYDLVFVMNSLKNIKIESNLDNLVKEYNKIKTKLSKKYDGENLEFQVKMKLLSKGYTMEEINICYQ